MLTPSFYGKLVLSKIYLCSKSSISSDKNLMRLFKKEKKSYFETNIFSQSLFFVSTSYNSGCQYYYNKKVLNLESSFGTISVKWNGSANNFLFNFTRSFLWSVIQPFLPVNRDGQHYKRQHSTRCQNDMIKEVALFIYSALYYETMLLYESFWLNIA